MKYPVYSIRDAHVGFNTPFCEVNDNVAKRNFTYAVNNPNNAAMNFSPKDFDLFKIGEFDLEKGKLKSEAVPVLVVSGLSVFNAEVK